MDQLRITRCYRYALCPSAVQRRAKAAYSAGKHWNALVATERYAEHEIEHGRRGSIGSALTGLLLEKKLTGVAALKARERSERDGIPQLKAAQLNRIEQAKAQRWTHLQQEGPSPAPTLQSQAGRSLCHRKRRGDSQDERRG